jgi:hypothetical protein
MGKYFGREPRYSREEIERQAQEAIDARVSLGRPPAEDWAPLNARLAEIDQALAARTMPEAQPMTIHEVRMPMVPAAATSEEPAPKRPVGAGQNAN